MVAFKVMTWNLENLFSPPPSDEKKIREYEEKLRTLAEVILRLDADVVGVQEVGNPEAFDDLRDRLDGRYPHHQLSTKPDARGIRVGFLSKLSIEDSEEIVDFPPEGLASVPGQDDQGNPVEVTRLSRAALRVAVTLASRLKVNLINNHWKSKLLTFPGGRFTTSNENERARVAGMALLKRTAEAVAVRVKANELLVGNQTQGLIVLGDLNDVTEAATTQILHGPSGSEIGTRGFNQPDKGDDARLFNLAPLIPLERRFSRVFKGSGELIDHILVSQELLPFPTEPPKQPRRLPTVDSHVDALGALPSITETPSERRGKPGSDHAPVTATFDL
jgi:endonuclease/exonuclease/phosphatase family metal-dependent hydrolase